MSFLILKSEDTPHTTGDNGVPILVVRHDASSPLAGTTEDYTMLQVDATGNLKVAGAVTTSGTVTEANSAAIKTAVEKVATEVSVGSGLKVNGAVTTSGTVTEASGADIKTATEKLAAEVSVGSGIKVNGAVTTSGTVTEANSGSIKTAVEVLSGYALKTDSPAQLTAAGSTTGFLCSGCSVHTMYALVAAINTSVTLRVEGSFDNSNWTNLNVDGLDTLITGNGSYIFNYVGALKYIRGTFVSEVGGTDVTVDFDYLGVA